MNPPQKLRIIRPWRRFNASFTQSEIQVLIEPPRENCGILARFASSRNGERR